MRDRAVAAVGEQYEIQAEIGRGGMAVVYRAMDRRLRRKVAIKVLPPEFAFREDVRRRFQREAEMAARLCIRTLCRSTRWMSAAASSIS